MAVDQQQLQQAAANYLANKQSQQKPPTFAQPKQSFDAQINSMPNAEKLTDFERKVYKTLPGVTNWMENNRIFGETISDQLDKFNNSWAGKALNFLDFAAEGLERSVGLFAQMQDPNFNMKDLRAAWYAGSLTYDTLNVPRLKRGTQQIVDPITGRVGNPVIGFELPTDLPGAKAGLGDARESIARYIQLGFSPKEALDRARDEYYNGLGALALRAQGQDMWGHVLGDPLNFISGALKPLQALKAKRFAALSKITGTVEDLVTKGDDVYKLAKTAENLEDAFKYTEEAYQFAQATGDLQKASKISAELADLAKQTGRAEDFTRLTAEGAEFTRIAGNAEEAAQYTSRALADLGKKQITRGDKVAIFLTGGDPFRPTKVGQALRKIPGVGLVAKAFELTPAAKAHELLTLVGDNIGANLISRVINNVDAEADFVNAIHRMKKGSTGIEYGHALLTQQGRTVQGFLAGADFDLQKTLNTYQKLAPQRQQLQFISETLGEAPSKILKMADENPKAVMQMLAGKSPVIDEMIGTGQLNEDVLKSLRRMFPDDGSVPYNREMFFATALDAIETSVARQAVVQFGIEAKGTLTRWSDALKAAESLAFLRLSPAYPIRNMINNEVTMISRGLFGVVDNQMVDDFWKGFGFTPARLEEMGLSADIAKASFSKAESVIDDALHGGEMALPDKAKEFFQNLNLGKLDTAKFSQKFEKAAGRRAFTLGAQQYLRKYWKPKSVKEYVNPRVFDQLDQVAPGLGKQIDNAIRSSGAMETKLDELIGKNLNLSVDSILDDVTAKTGQEAREVLGDEMVEFIHQKLPKAIEDGKLDAFKVEARQMMEKHVDGLFQKQLENLVEHVKSQAVAGGPNVWMGKLGEAQDVFWGAHMEHAMRMPDATKAAREAAEMGDFKAARALWEQEFLDSRNMYNRAFKRTDAYIQGLEEGTAELAKRGVKLPFGEVRRTFNQWKGMWEEFFTARNKLYDDFFKAADLAPKGQKPKFDDVRVKMSKMFDENIAKEDEFAQRLDDTIAGMLPDQFKQPFMNSRDQLAELRKADKLEVKKMFDMDFENGGQKQEAWNAFWQARVQRYQEMRSVDAASLAIQQGDEAAVQAFVGTGESAGKTDETFDIFKTASEYGIPSATNTGQRNNRRILATVNKYIGGSEPKIPMNKTVEVPRSELPPAVSEKFERLAKELQSELFEGQAGKRVKSEILEGGAVTSKWSGISSTNADWYRELYKEGLRKPAIDKALEKIVKDKGADTGKTVEKLKETILQRLSYGDPKKGVPPDLYALQELGASKATMQRALDDYNEITRQSLKLDEAIDATTPAERKLGDVTRPYYDESGKLIQPKKYTRVEDIPEDVARQAFETRAAEKVNKLPDGFLKEQDRAVRYPDYALSFVKKYAPDRVSEVKDLRGEKLRDFLKSIEPKQAASKKPLVKPNFIADVNKVIPPLKPIDLAMDQNMYGRIQPMLDNVINGAQEAAKKPATLLKDLPEDLQAQVMKAMKQVKNDFASTRYQAVKFGEWRRDSALLNYQRRTNFDNFLGHIAPFGFWTTHSMFNWMIESIDRPAMLTNYLRVKKFMATNGLERDGMPSRVKGKFRIDLPFAPEWMGEQFVDPLRLMLPFDNWLSPFDQMKQEQESVEGRAERTLEQMLKEGKINQDDFDVAMQNRSGSTWEYAMSVTKQNQEGDTYDAWDFGTALQAPHAPIMWAYNAAFGDKEDIPSFSPISRLARNTATILGVEDWNNSKWNLEAKLRRSMGLNSFDKWDDYRIDRSLANLAGDGSFTPDEVKEAMAISALVQQGKMTPDEAKKMSEAYREGVKRSNQEFTGGIGGYVGSLLGLSVTTVPEGETELRALQDDFSMAYQQYKKADESMDKFLAAHPEMDQEAAMEAWEKQNPKLAKDADALRNFFDEHPEYENRLAIFDKPEERMHKFMVDEVWKHYNELPKVNKDEVREHLGEDFQQAFLNKETRSYDDVPAEVMAVWLKMMNVDPLGGLTADQRLLVSLYGKVKMTDPEMAWRAETFYTTRDSNFQDWRDLQEQYYQLPKPQRKTFIKQNPQLKQYWDWRTTYFRDNPDIVPYVTDSEKAIEEAKRRSRTESAVPTAQELNIQLDPTVRELLALYSQQGGELPQSVMRELDFIGGQYNLTGEQLLPIVQQGTP